MRHIDHIVRQLLSTSQCDTTQAIAVGAAVRYIARDLTDAQHEAFRKQYGSDVLNAAREMCEDKPITRG